MDPGMMMALMSALSGVMGNMNGKDAKQSSSFSEGQQGLNQDIINQIKSMRGGAGGGDITKNQGFQSGQNWINDLFNDENFFNKFEAPMQRNFQENIIPELSNRFSGMGSGGGADSSAFRNQLGRAGVDLQTNIAAMRGGMQQQGANQALQYAQQPISNYMQMYQQAMGQPMMNQYQPATTGGWGSMAAPFAQGAVNYWGGQGGQNNNNNQGYGNGGGNQQSAAGYDAYFRNNPSALY